MKEKTKYFLIGIIIRIGIFYLLIMFRSFNLFDFLVQIILIDNLIGAQ